MKRIVIIRPHVGSFGSVGSYNVQEIGLANALMKMGNEVIVLFCNRNVHDITKSEKYDYVYYLPHKHIGIHGIFNVNLLNNYAPDIVIMFSDNQLWAKNIINWCKKRNIRCVQYMGNVLSDTPHWLNQAYTKLILFRNRRSYNYSINMAKTERVKKEIIKYNIPFSKVVNVGLDSDILSNKRNCDKEIRHFLGIAEDEIALLFIGRLVDYKKPVLACKILQTLKKRGLRCRLTIIGKGELEDTLNKYIKDNNIDNSISWIKNVPYDEIYKYMVSSDVFINLSPKEIFGMAILESMYYGLPVVANHAPGPNTIIEDGVSGYLCDYGDDAEKWADKVLEAYQNRESLSQNSRKRIKDHFMWDSLAGEFLTD